MSAPSSGPYSRAVKPSTDLSPDERVFFHDRLLEARCAALAEVEGFQQMCFAIDALGKRSQPDGNGLGPRRRVLNHVGRASKLPRAAEESDLALKNFAAPLVARFGSSWTTVFQTKEEVWM